ncbi:ubiquitin-protein ligase [Culex quinquefasciatus]|uniref:Ubiquitin-protein ligase n=1 Tax=Culex quinquefasciatus TaxID=7176 RepID=B0VZC4_CULQU|nr:ubiquitin-protein ligase [Culex quinquefasciatus]|eukprot:XP_001841762.1 ubiquitin-protein ligase [Culex quinquefasciatus]
MFKNCVDAICDPSRLDFPSIKYIATASLQSMSVISEHTDENRDIIHAKVIPKNLDRHYQQQLQL